MSVSQMRAEDRLDEASNLSTWKNRITFVWEDPELWDIVQAPVVIPPATAPSPLLDVDFRKQTTKAKRTICDVVSDHIIPESQPEPKDGSAGLAQGHSDARFRVGHIIPR
jgi:hypothetical protein